MWVKAIDGGLINLDCVTDIGWLLLGYYLLSLGTGSAYPPPTDLSIPPHRPISVAWVCSITNIR